MQSFGGLAAVEQQRVSLGRQPADTFTIESCALPYIHWLPVVMYALPTQILFFGFLSDIPLKKAFGNLVQDARTTPSVFGIWLAAFAFGGSAATATAFGGSAAG